MADNLNIFGVEYNNVAGIMATNDNEQEETYINVNNIPTDSTLTVQGMAADAKKVGDEITNLKSDFSKGIDYAQAGIDENLF